MFVEGPNTERSAPADPELRISYNTRNRFIFKLVFKAQKIRKAAPKASKQTTKFDTNDLEVPNVDLSIQKSITK